VEARSGDRLIFQVHNNLTGEEGLAMHWHGLFMRNANKMDGALGLTQSAIPSGGIMVYEYDIADDQCGTFWYHAHSQLQSADGLYGGLVVHCPDNPERESEYVNDILLLIGDWYHRPAEKVLGWYHHYRSFGNEVSFSLSTSLTSLT
jgi:FtsP/CotA-like multicopper oxidase with cupredoxin domain